MASGTGNSLLLQNAHPISSPNSMSGDTASYASRGGYIPGVKKSSTKKGTKHGGGSKKRRAKKGRSSTKSKVSKK